MALLLSMAVRNVLARGTSLLMAGILAAGAAALVVGGAFLDGVQRAMQQSIAGSAAGHAQLYHRDSEDELSLFGALNAEPSLRPIEDFAQVAAALSGVPNVKALIPMGTVGASLGGGHVLDERLARLRRLVREQGAAAGAGPVAAHVRRMVELVAAEQERAAAVTRGSVEPALLEDLRRAAADGFWAELERDPLPALELLENRIAPQLPGGNPVSGRFLGTDLDAFARAFERFELVEGSPVPPGQRGVLLNRYFYEDALKLRVARRLDLMKRAFDAGDRFAESDELRLEARKNQGQADELLFQLDPEEAAEASARLARLLGPEASGQDLPTLLGRFFDLDDSNFPARYAWFYAELAPLLDLYRYRPGDTLPLTAVSRSGYVQSAGVTLHGIFQFRGLEDSDLAGAVNLVDLATFRRLYGFRGAAEDAESEALRREAGARPLPREGVEDALFGGGGAPEQATPPPAPPPAPPPEEPRLVRAVDPSLSPADLRSGVVVNVAVVLEDPERLPEALADLRGALDRAGLPLRVVPWSEAAGFVGQLARVAGLILSVAAAIAFLVALIVLNNSLVMATLQRTRELGTMRAIGAQRGLVLRLVLLEAGLLGAAASAAGAGAGAALVLLLSRSGIPAGGEGLSFFFGGPSLHPPLGGGAVALGFLVVVAVSLASSLYPAVLATRVAPRVAMES